MQSSLKAVIWDKDGTITDVHSYWKPIILARAGILCLHYHLPVMGRKGFRDTLASVMGLNVRTGKLKQKGPIGIYPRSHIIQKVYEYLTSRDIVCSPVDIGRLFDNIERVQKDFLHSELLPGVVELMEFFKTAGVKQFLLTSDSVHNAEKVLLEHGLMKYFTQVYGRESFHATKETGEACKSIADQFGFSPLEILAIGDSPIDIEMAKNAGLQGCITVATGQTPFAQLKKGALRTCKDLKEVLCVLAPGQC